MDRKIKICHLTSVHRATDTRIFYKECRSLASLYDVSLITPAGKDSEIDGVKIIALRRPKTRLERFIITDTVLLIKAAKLNAALYHFHDPELIIAALVLRLLGKKIIYDVHEMVVADFDEKKWLPFKSAMKAIYHFFENLALRYFNLVLADEAYAEIYNSRKPGYTVIQNFVPLRELKVNEPYHVESNAIAFVGMLSARRGLPYILEALAILKQKNIRIILRCIGEVNEDVKEILKNSSSWNEIKEQVDFKGYIPFPQSILDVRDCMAGVALLEDLPNNQKSFSTKMFEYMAVGLPVICSDFQVFKDIIEKYDCGVAASPENPESIAAAIESLFFDKARATQMSVKAKSAAINFDWKTEEEKLLEFYNRILIHTN